MEGWGLISKLCLGCCLPIFWCSASHCICRFLPTASFCASISHASKPHANKASCKTVNQWNVKNSAESENISWIRAHTKKCPKCRDPTLGLLGALEYGVRSLGGWCVVLRYPEQRVSLILLVGVLGHALPVHGTQIANSQFGAKCCCKPALLCWRCVALAFVGMAMWVCWSGRRIHRAKQAEPSAPCPGVRYCALPGGS